MAISICQSPFAKYATPDNQKSKLKISALKFGGTAVAQVPAITRLAPSPTGLLHLGNAWSFLLCWLAARSSGGKVILRIDDIDPQRSRPEFIDAIVHDLAWLGLDWDADIVFQSARTRLYAAALENLQAQNLVYPCFCTRKELRSLAAAPHLEDMPPPYPGTCANLAPAQRENMLVQGRPCSLRMRCPDAAITFGDIIQGQQHFTKMEHGGDFPLRRSDGVWSYQLASTVDDAETGVNLIVRGRDLLSSTPRQIILAHALDFSLPQYAHVPLLLDQQGERLAKRHKSLAIAAMRAAGLRPAQVIGRLARLAGFNPDNAELMPAQLLPYFRFEMLPKQDLLVGNDLAIPG